MPVYVDHMKLPFKGRLMSHMTADTLAELHDMAGRIGMKREWFQTPPKASYPHHDVDQIRREIALQTGAIAVNRRTGLYYAAKLGIEWAMSLDDDLMRDRLLFKYRRSFLRFERYAIAMEQQIEGLRSTDLNRPI